MLHIPLAFIAWGILYGVFAFYEPPGFLRRIFYVPSIFVFLPDAWAMRGGRLVCGVICIGAGLLIGFKAGIF